MALSFFVFSMPLFFLPGNTEYGYTKSVYTLTFVSLLLILWGIEGLFERRWEVEVTPLWPLLPGLLLASLVSLAGGTPACVVLQSAALLLYFGFLYLLIANTSQEDYQVTMLLGALLASGFLAGLYGLLQYLGVMRGGPGTGLDALISTMGNRNYLGGFLSYLLFPAGILLFRLRRPWARALALVGLGFVLAMALFVQQTGVRVGLICGAGFVALGLGLWPVRGWKGWPWWAGGVGVGFFALGGVLGLEGLGLALVYLFALGGAAFGVGRLVRRLRWAWVPVLAVALLGLFLVIPPTTPIPGMQRLWEENAGRVRAWDWWVGYEMWRDHPLTGVGLGGYKISFVPYKADFLATPRGAGYNFPIARAAQAHNEYVQLAAETGAVGFLVLLCGIGLVAYWGLRRLAAQGAPERRLELLLLGAGLVATFVHAAVSFPWHLPASSLAFITALGIAFSPRYAPAGSFSIRLKGKALKATVAGLAIGGVLVSVIAVRDLVADRYLFAGQNSLYLGNVPRAKAQLSRAVALDFCPRLSLYWLGLAKLQAGDLSGAQATFRAAFKRYKPEPLYLNLASVDVELGDFPEARALLSELLSTRPNRETELGARYLLAVLELKEKRDYVAAEARLKEILNINPRFERALILLGDIAKGTYRYEEARGYYERALGVIDREIARLEERLQRELSAEEYGAIRGDLTRLRREREAVERSLAELP
ncbi:MAG: O-antigen ligase-related protein [Acetothermia bacterium 64_32]|nr:MAG: O-antigen ligase-related protein [Acetothermia bacterium 64_32]